MTTPYAKAGMHAVAAAIQSEAAASARLSRRYVAERSRSHPTSAAPRSEVTTAHASGSGSASAWPMVSALWRRPQAALIAAFGWLDSVMNAHAVHALAVASPAAV